MTVDETSLERAGASVLGRVRVTATQGRAEFGRFRVLRKLGAGAMGVVFLAHDPDRNVHVALKALNHLQSDSVYRLKTEFRSLAGVAHQNLVQMHELLCVDEQWFFVMEYVEGVSFVEYCRRIPTGSVAHAPPPERTAAVSDEVMFSRIRAAFGQLIAGVHALHESGKVHRDLKPSNVLVAADGRVVILDFGLSCDATPAPDQSSASGLTGTPLYMAPEQLRGEPATPATDWYAVGLMLYQALTGHVPFDEAPQRSLLSRLVRDLEPPITRFPGIPDDLNLACEQLLRREPSLRPAGGELLQRFVSEARPSRSSLRPESLATELFVGRVPELALLAQAAQRAHLGSPVLVSISGESGVGKTALVNAYLQKRRGDPNVLILTGRCYEQESVPYKAFDQVADGLSRFLNRCGETEAALLMPRNAQALEKIFPVLKRVQLLQHQPGNKVFHNDPARQRSLGFGAFRELLCRLCDQREVIIWLDDVQWSDEDSAALLKDVLSNKEPPGCLLITTSRNTRPAILEGLFNARAPKGGASLEVAECQLMGLSPEEASELGQRMGVSSVEQLRALEHRSRELNGNPYFVGLLAQHAVREPDQDASFSVIVEDWIRDLPELPLKLLRLIAIAGRPIHETTLQEASNTMGTDHALALLATHHFVSGWPTRSRLIECYHDQIRERVIASLTPTERCVLHGAIAAALQAQAALDVPQLATHFLAAGNGEQGAIYAKQAAEEAIRSFAFVDAAQWYARALHVTPRGAAERCALQVQIAEAYVGAGRGVLAAEWFIAAAQAAPVGLVLNLKQRAAELLLASGHLDAGIVQLEELLRHIHMRLAKTPRRALLSLIWQRLRISLRGYRFRERPAAECSAEDLLRIDVCWSVATGLSFIDPVRGADFQTRNLRLSLATGEPYRVARALALEAGFRMAGGKRGERAAGKLTVMARSIAKRVQSRHAQGLVLFSIGMQRYLIGGWRAAFEHFDQATQTLKDLPGAIWELNAARRFRLNALSYLGDMRSVADSVPEFVSDARERGNLYAECALRLRLSSLMWLAKDDPLAGIEEINDVMERWSPVGVHLQHHNELLARVSCALYQGNVSDAMRRLERTWPKLQASLVWRTQLAYIEALQLRTRVYAARLRQAPGERGVRHQLEGDSARLRKFKLPWATAYATLARAMLALNSPGKASESLAVSHLKQATQEFSALGMEQQEQAARFVYGISLGGAEGASAMASAERWFRAHDVVDPARFVNHLIPFQ